MTAWRSLLTGFVVAAALLAALPLRAAGDGLDGLVAGSPAAGIYGSNHLAGLPDKAVLVFDYTFEGTLLDKPFSDNVLLDFTRRSGGAGASAGPNAGEGAGEGDRGFDVAATLFPQTRKLEIGPLSAARVNPILLIFFQRDATQMSNGTGGNQNYFRNTIRRVLQTPDPDSLQATTIQLDGRDVAASAVDFRPFAKDPNRARLREFADKNYHFVLSDDVPGGIYEVSTETPTADGNGTLLRETYRFREMRQ